MNELALAMKVSAAVIPTPGPYAYLRSEDGCDDFWLIVPEHGPETVLASILFWDDDPLWTEQTKANARLFAGAPQMLTALRALLDAATGTGETYFEAVDLALAALAKVAGRD